MKKAPATFLVLLGTIIAIAPFNPFGDPNLHPNPMLVFGGALIGIVGAWLFGWKVEPPIPNGRRIAGFMIAVLAMLALVSFVW